MKIYKKIMEKFWDIFKNFDEIGDFWENFDKLHIFYWKTIGKPGNDFWWGYNKFLKKREIDFMRSVKEFW